MVNNYLSDEEYDFIYSRVPRICIDLLIKNSKGEVLLTKRDIEPYKDYWHFPGGRIKFRETVKQSIQRIIKSELGIVTEIISEHIGFCEFLDEVQNGNYRHSISLVHLVELDNEEFTLDNQAKEVKFFAELPNPIIPPQYEFLINKGWK